MAPSGAEDWDHDEVGFPLILAANHAGEMRVIYASGYDLVQKVKQALEVDCKVAQC